MSASCQWRYRARPVCLTMHTPSAITISVDGDGMIPADANDNGWQDRSAAESGRKPPRPSSKTSTGSWPSTPTPPQPWIWSRRFPERASSTRPRWFVPRRSVSSDASGPVASAKSRARRHQVSGVCTSRASSAGRPSPQQLARLSRCMSRWTRGAPFDVGE